MFKEYDRTRWGIWDSLCVRELVKACLRNMLGKDGEYGTLFVFKACLRNMIGKDGKSGTLFVKGSLLGSPCLRDLVG